MAGCVQFAAEGGQTSGRAVHGFGIGGSTALPGKGRPMGRKEKERRAAESRGEWCARAFTLLGR